MKLQFFLYLTCYLSLIPELSTVQIDLKLIVLIYVIIQIYSLAVITILISFLKIQVSFKYKL